MPWHSAYLRREIRIAGGHGDEELTVPLGRRRRPVLATSAVITRILDSLPGGRCGLCGANPPDGVGPRLYLLLLRRVFKPGIGPTP